MRDIVQDVEKWLTQNETVGVATVVKTWGSAPRGIGAKMAFTSNGQISGSVSGGCVEGAVVEAGFEVLESAQPQLLEFGVADDLAWDVGLACGGSIEVFVERIKPAEQLLIHNLSRSNQPFAVATVISGTSPWLGNKIIVEEHGEAAGDTNSVLAGPIISTAQSVLSGGKSQRQRLAVPDEAEESIELFVEVINPAPTLVMIGGVHIAIVLAAIAKELGYLTIVIDPRKAFASQERFANVDTLIQAWPDEAFEEVKLTSFTAVAILTHDPKIDDPALLQCLSSPVFYIGALGSRSTHDARSKRLVDRGVSDRQLARIHAPIGLDIGASSPEEIAISIMAEIVAARHIPLLKMLSATFELN
ncbi:MAG TPA: XdhC family protein [candidate division Zixibacteria bacterium]|nr:XdhC family protein [candidate division Zixibacteria bacterium]